jgi:MATE family multidrug resistance protein
MTAITDLAGSPPMPLARHISRTVQLAAPIVVARAAVLVMTVIDTAMTGWAGTEELAALGLGVAPQLTLQMIAIGFLQATPILAAQAIGSGRGQEAGIVLRSGLLHALGLGLAFIALSFLSAWFFRLTGQPEDVVTKAAAVSLAFSLGLPGMLLFVTCSMFLEATGRPKTAMTVLIVAALIDLPLNGIFALGWGGFIEPMGAVGAVGTSSVMRALAFLVTLGLLVRWEARLGDPRGVLDALRNWRERRPFGSRLRRIGIPIGLAQGVESAAFSAMVFLGGAISTQALAAHQATLSLLSLIYMSAVGIGGATAIRVGNAVGRGSAADLRLAGWSGIALAGAAALPFAAIMFLSAGMGGDPVRHGGRGAATDRRHHPGRWPRSHPRRIDGRQSWGAARRRRRLGVFRHPVRRVLDRRRADRRRAGDRRRSWSAGPDRRHSRRSDAVLRAAGAALPCRYAARGRAALNLRDAVVAMWPT